MDEVDSILDVLKSFHYTIGTPKPLDPLYIETVSDLYQFISTDRAVNEKIRFSFSQTPGDIPFTTEQYDSAVKPLLSRAILEGRLGKQDRELQDFLSTLDQKEREHIDNYMKGHSHEGEHLLLEKASEHVQDCLALYKEEINELIPLTARKNLNEHYGKAKTGHLAIPYHLGKPSANSTFGTEIEQENFAIQMVLEEGFTEDVIQKEAIRVQELFHEESRRFPDRKPEELGSYRLFLRMTGGDPRYSIFNITLDDIRDIRGIVNADRALQMELIKRYVLPEIKVYETQLNADGQIFGILFKQLQGMTGTLWNAKTFTKLIEKIIPSDTAPKTMELIWEKSPESVDPIALPILNKTDRRAWIRQVLQQLYNRKDIPNGSLIDAANLFRDIPDRAEIAEEMIQMECWKGTPIKGVAYYDSRDKIMVMKLVEGKPPVSVPLSKCGLAKEELIVFCDQQRIRGSDIKLGLTMTAAVAVGRHTIWSDLQQAVFRLRDLPKGQRANFIVSEEDEMIIKSTLQNVMGIVLKKEEKLQLEHILLYTIYNQSQRQSSDNYRSLKQKMQALLLEKVYSVLLDLDIPQQELATLYTACRELFATTQTARPFDLYGRTKTLEAKKDIVEKDIQEILAGKAMQAFRTHPLLKDRFQAEEIEKAIRKLAEEELENLADKLLQADKYGKTRTVQVELRKEKETAKETQTLQQRRVEHPSSRPVLPEIKWPEKDLFAHGCFTSAKVSAVLHKDPSEIQKSRLQPLAGVQDLLGSYPALAAAARHFDPKLSCSLNLCPAFASEYTPFGFYQKEITYALAIEDKDSGGMQLLLLDQNDAAYFKAKLIEDHSSDSRRERQVRLALYHFGSETLVYGKEEMEAARFKNDPKILKLTAQAKFFLGDSSYNDPELVELEKWLKESDAKTLHALFQERILEWKEESEASYEQSPLHRLFIRLGVA
jgi:hypothetical protein